MADTKKRDVPELDELVRPADGRYMESEDHRPEPWVQYGTLDTSDTAGGAHNNVNEVSPVFAAARAANLIQAAKALDPEDPTPSELVTLPEGSVTVHGTAKTADEGRDDVFNALDRLRQHPVELGGATEEQQKAAEEDDADDNSAATKEDEGDKEPDAPIARRPGRPVGSGRKPVSGAHSR